MNAFCRRCKHHFFWPGQDIGGGMKTPGFHWCRAKNDAIRFIHLCKEFEEDYDIKPRRHKRELADRAEQE